MIEVSGINEVNEVKEVKGRYHGMRCAFSPDLATKAIVL